MFAGLQGVRQLERAWAAGRGAKIEGSPVRTRVQIPLPVQLAAIQVFRREPIKLAHLPRIPPGCQQGSQETAQMSEWGSIAPRTWSQVSWYHKRK